MVRPTLNEFSRIKILMLVESKPENFQKSRKLRPEKESKLWHQKIAYVSKECVVLLI